MRERGGGRRSRCERQRVRERSEPRSHRDPSVGRIGARRALPVRWESEWARPNNNKKNKNFNVFALIFLITIYKS